MEDSPVTKKSLGQHWLFDEYSLEAICESSDLQNTDTVLEVGPGLGTLTKLLTEKADQVVAVEFDKALASNLHKRVPASNLTVVSEDILGFNLTSLPKNYKLVANIPYYLTNKLVRAISESDNSPILAALLVQKEVAERIAAKPGGMSLLSVTAQFYWEVNLGVEVPSELFTPQPKVDSQIVILKRHKTIMFPDVNPKDYFRVVKAGFAQRRKTLLNSLSAGLRIEREAVALACESVEIEPTRRAQTLSLEEWYNLYISLNT